MRLPKLQIKAIPHYPLSLMRNIVYLPWQVYRVRWCCDSCYPSYGDPFDWTEHFRRTHLVEFQENGYRCEECNIVFKLIHECCAHHFNKHVTRFFECKTCLNRFHVYLNLKEHICVPIRPCERCGNRSCVCCSDEFGIPYPQELFGMADSD